MKFIFSVITTFIMFPIETNAQYLRDLSPLTKTCDKFACTNDARKVAICHYDNGIRQYKELCVAASGARGHIQNHPEDYCGPCTSSPSSAPSGMPSVAPSLAPSEPPSVSPSLAPSKPPSVSPVNLHLRHHLPAQLVHAVALFVGQ